MTTSAEALQATSKLYDRLVKQRKGRRRRFAYLDGEHNLAYATQEWKQFHANRYKGFSDNWTGVVSYSAVDRMQINGFRLGDSTEALTPDEQQIWTDWNRNELEGQSSQGFLETDVAKRSYTIVWGNEDDEPVVTWEGCDQVVVETGPLGQVVRALKSWVEDDVEYATLYLSDELWKWKRPALTTSYGTSRESQTDSGLFVVGGAGMGGWEPREVSDEPWPLPNPLGEVPVAEWSNRPRLGGEAISSIDGTIAMQDAINMMWAYLFSAADYASMPARVVTGAEPPKVPILDADGQIIGHRAAKMEDLARGRMLFLPGKNGAKVDIDQWDAAKLDVFTGVVVQSIGHIAAQTATPGHYMLTNEKFANLNADALTAAEVPLATKVAAKELHLNPAAKRTVALMARVRGNDALAAKILATEGRRFVQWKDPAMHSLGQVADAATKDRAVGMSLRTVLERRYGMTEQEIDREMDRIQAEALDPVLAQIMRGSGDAPVGG